MKFGQKLPLCAAQKFHILIQRRRFICADTVVMKLPLLVLVAIIYFVSFIIINYMIVINMYIAIILENFNQAHQEEEIGIVEEDLEMFYTKWAK